MKKSNIILVVSSWVMFIFLIVIARYVNAVSIIDSGTTEPGSPVTGQEFYRTDFHAHEIYDGQWIRQDKEVYNVKAYGAKGDGIDVNDGLKIQAAIDAVPASGGTVFIPAGTYITTNTIVTKPNLMILGAGLSTIIQKSGDGSGIDIRTNVVLTNFTLRGTNNSAHTTGSGINGGSTTDSTIQNLIIEQWARYGINMGGYSLRNRIINNTIRDNLDEGIFLAIQSNYNIIYGNIVKNHVHNGIDINGGYNIIRSNIVTGSGTAVIGGNFVDISGIYVWPSDATPIENNIIEGNNIELNGGPGIYIQTSAGATSINRYNIIANNICRNNGSMNPSIKAAGIVLDAASAGGYNPALYGVIIGNRISGNICTGNTLEGIKLDAAGADCIITGNQAFSNATTGIAVNLVPRDNNTNTVISNNICRSNGNYGIGLGYGFADAIIATNIVSNNGAGDIVTIDGPLRNVFLGNKQGLTATSLADYSSMRIKSVDEVIVLPTTGKGMEIYYDQLAGIGYLRPIDRDAGAVIKSLVLDSSSTQITNGSTAITKHLSATTTWDPGNISNGAADTTTITVSGAALGDTVVATFDQIGTYKMQITGHVQAANAVRVVLANHNGAGVNLGSGTVRVDVWKH